MKITSVVTTISAGVFKFITKVINSNGLEIKEILLSQQAISQSNLSESALIDGSVLIHVEEDQTYITINKNLSTIASMSIYDFGYEQLITGIQKIFGIQKDEARDLVTLYGSLKEDTNRVIVSKKVDHIEKTYTTVDLNRIIKAFMTKLLSVAKQFLAQKNVSSLPVIISGGVEQLDGVLEFSNSHLDSTSVSVYNPISFIEINLENKEAIGATLFNKRIDEINGRQLNTIVETNPNLISSLKKKHNISLLNKIIEKIGGKNV